MTADTIGRQVEVAAREFGPLEALVCTDEADCERRLTFAQLRDEVLGAAAAFLAHGLQRGDRVAIWAPNIGEWVIAALGASSAGGVLVPLNTRFKGREAADIIERSGASMLLCVNGFLGNDYIEMLRDAGCDSSVLRTIVVLRGDVPDGTIHWSEFLAHGVGATAIDEARTRIGEGSADDLSDIIYTSGTTGRPKGVMCSHGQTMRVFDVWSGVIGLTSGDRYLVVNPFFHTFGYKAGFLSCIIRGATIVPELVFDVRAVLRRVAAERITVLPGPPTIYLSILDVADRTVYDLSSLRLAVTGAAVVPVEMIRRMREELTFRVIVTAYGLTETTGVVSICDPDDSPEIIATTSGRAIPDTEVRIIDDDGNEVPRGATGEIVCRGYHVMRGYHHDPEATVAAIDAAGWLHTGDIGTMDAHGYLAITDRKKDMFIVGGFNAYPAEIENVLLEHPAVANVAVVGIPDTRQGEVGHAFVVAKAGSTIEADEMIAWCRERMANFKVPRAVHVVGSLPTTASGKVRKVELRASATT